MPWRESGLEVGEDGRTDRQTENKLRYGRCAYGRRDGWLRYVGFSFKGSQMAFQHPQGDGSPPHSSSEIFKKGVFIG